MLRALLVALALLLCTRAEAVELRLIERPPESVQPRAMQPAWGAGGEVSAGRGVAFTLLGTLGTGALMGVSLMAIEDGFSIPLGLLLGVPYHMLLGSLLDVPVSIGSALFGLVGALGGGALGIVLGAGGALLSGANDGLVVVVLAYLGALVLAPLGQSLVTLWDPLSLAPSDGAGGDVRPVAERREQLAPSALTVPFAMGSF